jgi:hypothetical protein
MNDLQQRITDIDWQAVTENSLNLVRTIFDNIYNLPLFISYYNFKSGIINPDGIGYDNVR